MGHRASLTHPLTRAVLTPLLIRVNLQRVPELPDITIYLEALEKRVLDHRLERIQLNSPFLLRTATPPISAIEGNKLRELRRLGKRICFGFESDLWLILHLMIAGRLHWQGPAGAGAVPARLTRAAMRAAPTGFPKNQLALFHFDDGVLSLTEAGTQRRASLRSRSEEHTSELQSRGL